MKTKLLNLWESVHTSFWFLPAPMAAVAIGLSFTMVRLDRSVSLKSQKTEEFFYPGSPEGARLVLSTIAGSTITVAGVVFSITIAALTMAGAQFGPRLLRSFMADRSNQTVLGTFVGTFIYCLLVLRTIHGDGTSLFIPRISITLGIALALASFGVLIYFFHHASSSIQAEQVVDTIYRELLAELDATFPPAPEPGDPGEPPGPPPEFESAKGTIVTADASGYLRVVD